jgi:hypothetical protein
VAWIYLVVPGLCDIGWPVGDLRDAVTIAPVTPTLKPKVDAVLAYLGPSVAAPYEPRSRPISP